MRPTTKKERAEFLAKLSLRALACTARALSDNGSSYIAGDLAEWLEDRGIRHIRGAPFHPLRQTGQRMLVLGQLRSTGRVAHFLAELR